MTLPVSCRPFRASSLVGRSPGALPRAIASRPFGAPNRDSLIHEAGVHDLPGNARFGISVGRRDPPVQFPLQLVAEFGVIVRLYALVNLVREAQSVLNAERNRGLKQGSVVHRDSP